MCDATFYAVHCFFFGCRCLGLYNCCIGPALGPITAGKSCSLPISWLCVLVHGCLNGAAPGYLSDLTVSVASAARRRLRSASTSDLVVPATRRASIRDRAFAVAGPRAWNSLPPALRSTSTSFTTFKKELKSFLFGLSFCY